jgi:hypothetical protein
LTVSLKEFFSRKGAKKRKAPDSSLRLLCAFVNGLRVRCRAGVFDVAPDPPDDEE